MKLTYTDKINCNHALQMVHYSAPFDHIYIICGNCALYSLVEMSRVHHRILRLLNGLANIGPALAGIASITIALIVWVFHH